MFAPRVWHAEFCLELGAPKAMSDFPPIAEYAFVSDSTVLSIAGP
jgi:hypothetical protein